MDKESIQLILQHLDKLGEKLGVGVENVWPWFIRQVYLNSILSALVMLVSVGSLLGYCIFISRHWGSRDHDDNEYSISDSRHEPPWITGLFVLGTITIVCVVCFLDSGFDFLNPEYHAFKSILETVKP